MGIPEKPPKKKIYDAEKLFLKVLEGGTTKSSINQEETQIPCPTVRTRWNPSTPALTNYQKQSELEELRNSRSAVVEKLAVERSSSRGRKSRVKRNRSDAEQKERRRREERRYLTISGYPGETARSPLKEKQNIPANVRRSESDRTPTRLIVC